MQRWTAIAFCLAIAAAVVALILGTGEGAPPVVVAPSSQAPKVAPLGPAPTIEEPSLPPFDDPEMPDDPGLRAPADATLGGALLPSGEPPPKLPEDAPRSVGFGAILVRYRGAEGAPTTAPPREQALARAEALRHRAKDDFEAAAKDGDPGTRADAGSVPRGILEPAPEYVLFTLSKGEVGGPVDTPKGFWIVKRLR